MDLYGDLHVQGLNSILFINSNPDNTNPYSGWVTTDTVFESVSYGDALYYSLSSRSWGRAQSNSYSTMPCRGIALKTVVSGSSCLILRWGTMYDVGWNFLTGNLYISESSPGKITHTAPVIIGSLIQIIGFAKNNKVGQFDISPFYIEIS